LIIFAFSGAFLVFIILKVSLNTETPVVVVISGSMEPNIHEGDLLFVMGTDAGEIKIGDVIVFDASWGPQEPIVHRVIDIQNITGVWHFETKGDANSDSDPDLVSQYDVLGVVVGRIPYIGWVKLFLERYNLLIPLLVIISVLLVISIVRDIFKGDDEEEDKTNAKDQSDIDTQPQREE